MDWIARTQYMAQSGVPKTDIAFWLKSLNFEAVVSQYEPLDLVEAGYTYQYLSPDNFELESAVVEDGTLAPDAQAFKALVIRGNDTLTVSGVDKLMQFANDGLPIVVSGGLPQNLSGHDSGNQTEYVRSVLAGLEDLDNVHFVPYDNLASSLMALGLTPRTAVSSDRLWYTYWREDTNASITWAYVYNDAWMVDMGEGASTGAVTFETGGVPYMYDAWTGDVKQIYGYQQTNETTTIPLALAGNQSVIIGFHHDEATPSGTTILDLPGEVYSASAEDESCISVKAGNATEEIILSNGTSVTLPTPKASTTLSNWTLVVESWSPEDDIFMNANESVKANTTYHIRNLQPWNQISDSLRNTSGRGYYSTSFEWSSRNSSADGAMLSLGVLGDATRAWVNGNQLPPLDPTNAIADMGPYLADGLNQVEIVIGTTLGKALRPIYEDVRSSGTVWRGTEPVEQGYGLVEPVKVLPYKTTKIYL